MDHTGQNAHSRPGQHISGEVDAADDTANGQCSTEHQKDDPQPRTQPEVGHGDDKGGENMAAGEAFSCRLLVNDRLDVQQLIRPGRMIEAPKEGDHDKADSRHRNGGPQPCVLPQGQQEQTDGIGDITQS